MSPEKVLRGKRMENRTPINCSSSPAEFAERSKTANGDVCVLSLLKVWRAFSFHSRFYPFRELDHRKNYTLSGQIRIWGREAETEKSCLLYNTTKQKSWLVFIQMLRPPAATGFCLAEQVGCCALWLVCLLFPASPWHTHTDEVASSFPPPLPWMPVCPHSLWGLLCAGKWPLLGSTHEPMSVGKMGLFSAGEGCWKKSVICFLNCGKSHITHLLS